MPYKDKDKQKAAQRRNYLENKERYHANQVRSRDRARDYVNSVKDVSACKVCGVSDNVVLEFHHREPKLKKCSISKMIKDKYSISNIQKEIDKCDVLCANCHRLLHHSLKGF